MRTLWFSFSSSFLLATGCDREKTLRSNSLTSCEFCRNRSPGQFDKEEQHLTLPDYAYLATEVARRDVWTSLLI